MLFLKKNTAHILQLLYTKQAKKVTSQNLFSSLLLSRGSEAVRKAQMPTHTTTKVAVETSISAIPQLWIHRIQGWNRPVPASCSPDQKATAGMLNKIQQNKPVNNQHKQRECFHEVIQAKAPPERLLWALFPQKRHRKCQHEEENSNSNHQTEPITAATKAVPGSKRARLSLPSKTTLEGDVLENKPLDCLGYFPAFSKGQVPEQVNRPHKDATEVCHCSIV